MPSSQQSWFKPGLRFCGSCLVSLLYWAVWLLLGATLAALVYILVVREIPVPEFMLRRMETKLAEANFSIKFGHARFDPTGKILLENVQLLTKQFGEPLLTSRVVYLRRNLWSVLAGRPIPDEIRLEGTILQLPAMLSPSGIAEPLIRDLTAVLRHDVENVWHVEQLNARIGRLKVTVNGELNTPDHTSGAKNPSPEEITSRFLQVGRRLALGINQLEAFDEPSLDIHLETQAGGPTTADCTFFAGGAEKPWGQPVTIDSLSAKTKFRFDGRSEQTVVLHTSARKISGRGLYLADPMSALITARISPEHFTLHPIEAFVTLGSLTVDGEHAIGTMIRADLRNWPALKFSTAMQIGGAFVTAESDINIEERSARMTIDGTGAPEVINRALSKHTPRAAPYFIFTDSVEVKAEATLSRGWQFTHLDSLVTAGRFNSHGVKITSARGRIDIKGMNFLAYDAQVEMDENIARGSYWMNFASTDYRMLLKGQLHPPKISGWFAGEWWTDFWKEHFDFSGGPPEGDVDVQGRWRDVSRTEYFGAANARAASVWGGKFDQLHAVVFLRPAFTHIIAFDGTRAAGAQKLRGTLKRFSASPERNLAHLEFDLEGNVDSETYHGMLEGKADETFSALKFTSPPHVSAKGAVDGQGTDAKVNYTFTGQADNGSRFYGFPLQTVRVTGLVKSSDVQLEDIQFTAFGGKGAGKATLTGPVESRRLGFDLYLNNADLPQTIRAVQEYQMDHNSGKNVTVGESNLIKRASGGRLDVALSAQGIPGDLTSFVGTGNAAVNGANLGEIQLFGLLSQVLSGLSLNFSSLTLDSVHTSFRLEKGRLHFPDLKITGPSAAIDARGDFVFETEALDFTAKFKPFEESKNLLTAAIGIVINPITSILELKLTGPIKKPNWSIDVGSSTPRQ